MVYVSKTIWQFEADLALFADKRVWAGVVRGAYLAAYFGFFITGLDNKCRCGCGVTCYELGHNAALGIFLMQWGFEKRSVLGIASLAIEPVSTAKPIL